MAAEPVVTLKGNLAADPQLRFVASGKAVVNFTVADTPRSYDQASGEWKDGETLWMRCTLWGKPAENVGECLRKGMRVVVEGRLRQRSFQTNEGDKRTVVELDVIEVGASLAFASVEVRRNPSGNAVPAQRQQASIPPADEPAGGFDDDGGASSPWGEVPDSPADFGENFGDFAAPAMAAAGADADS